MDTLFVCMTELEELEANYQYTDSVLHWYSYHMRVERSRDMVHLDDRPATCFKQIDESA